MKKITYIIGWLLLGAAWGQTDYRQQHKTFETERVQDLTVAGRPDQPIAGIGEAFSVDMVRQQIKDHASQRPMPLAKRPKRAVKAPVQPPYYCTFDNAKVMEDEWIVIDGDADGRSWYYEWKGFFYPCDSNEASGFAAVLWNQDGVENQDWMITASPVSLPAGTSHISFYYGLAQPFFVEKLRVFYSKTPDTAMAKLTELGEFEIEVETGWYFAHVDFNLQEAGDYYFSFLYQVPDDNQYGVMLDNIRIDKGAFVGTPDLQVERIILPPASCNLGAAERIGVQLKNGGSADITEWAMTYSVNGGATVRETFAKTLAEGASDTVYFERTADFSAAGMEYNVEVEVEVLKGTGHPEEKTYNNKSSNKVGHFDPWNELPFEADLQTEEGLSQVGYNPDYWRPVEDGLNAVQPDILVTRCMMLEAGERYRFIFDYKAGSNTFLISPDVFYVLYGQVDKPLSEWDTLKRYSANTKNVYVRDEIVFEQQEPGDYGFAILPVRQSYGYDGTIYVATIRIEKIFDYDVRVESVRTTLATMMPARHALTPQFNIAVINRGEQDVAQAKVTVKQGDVQVGISETSAIRKNDTVYYTFGGTMSRPPVDSKVTFTVTADMEQADDNPDDNTAQWSFTATDSLYAFDDVTLETYRDGVGLQGLLLGNLFTLLETDTLTAVTLGWMDLMQFPLEPIVRMEIYPVAESGETGDCIYAADIERPRAGGVYTIGIRPRVLPAGRYIIGVLQVGADNMVLGYDRNPLGFFYVKPEGRNRVQTLGGYGNLAVRAIFGKTAEAYAKEVEILAIERPMERGVFAANEKIIVNYRNNGFEDLNLEFRCTVDGNVVSQLVEVPGYAQTGQIAFEADLSRKGAHEILVEAVLPGDERPDNNAVKKTVMCIVEDPYVMDFELCNDFAANDLYPWASVDVDLEFTAGIRGYDWPGSQSPMGFMAFNPYQTTPSMARLMVPHDGDRLGVAIVCANVANNDWLISPKLTLPEKDARLSFFTRAFTELAEQYNVLISTTTAELSAFDQLGETYTAPSEWDETVVDLSAYAGQDVYLAIQYVSEDAFVFLIDDIVVSKPLPNEGLEDLSRYVKSYPNPVSDVWTVTAYGLEMDRVEICDMAGGVVFRSAGNLATDTYRVNMDGFTPGLYMARVYTNAGVQTLKVVVR